MGLRGPSEVEVSKVAPCLARAPPASRLGGSRSSLSHREPGSVDRRQRLSWPRAPLQGTPEDRRPAAKPDGTLPGFLLLQRMRSHGSGRRGPRHLPATFRPQRFARSRRFTPRDTVRTSRSGNARGVPPSGTCSSPGIRASFEAVALLPLTPPFSRTARPGGTKLGSRAFFSPESPCRRGPKSATVVSLVTFAPLRRSLPPALDRLFPPRRLRGARAYPRPILPCPSPRGGGFGVLPPADSAFLPLREGAGLCGVSHLPGRTLANPPRSR
jgi:hypothetical protein